MGLLNLLPMSIRMAILYYRSFKVSKSENKTEREKLMYIYNLEKKLKGKNGFNINTIGREQAIAISIGRIDMAKIFNSINSPDDALRYLEGVDVFLLSVLSPDENQRIFKDNSLLDKIAEEIEKSNPNDNSKNNTIYENLICAWIYESIACSKMNNVERCKILFERVNVNLNKKIEEEPANNRLADLYKYSIVQTFLTFKAIAENCPDCKVVALNTCLSLLNDYNKKDPGNETIEKYLNKIKTMCA